MSATASAAQISQHTRVPEKEWMKLFPKHTTENYSSSVTFMKQLTVVAVSTITYLKNAFPEESYDSETFGGLQLKVLKNKCSDALAQFVSDAVRQAFEAIDKKYVQHLALCFYDGVCSAENLIEYHAFEYSYTGQGAVLTINSNNRNGAKNKLKCSLETVKLRTIALLRSLTLFVWENCQDNLRVNYDISMRLYYNEDAPEGYQAPGYQNTDDIDHLKDTASQAVRLGWVETPYHKLTARTFVRDLLGDSDTAVPSESQPQMMEPHNEDIRGSMRSSKSSLEPQLRCPCGKLDADQSMLTCQYCHMQQHQACFGFLAPVQEHCCESCADQDASRKPSDQLLVGLDNKKRECLCIFRRTLELCFRASSVAGEELMAKFQLSASSAAKMLRLLQSHQVLPKEPEDDLAAPRKVNRSSLKQAFKSFFHVEDQDTIVDRLVAETARVSFDPVAEALSREEQQALKSSTLGAVVHSPQLEPVSRDPMLQEYRDAILTNEDVSGELPLSGSHNPVKDVERIGKKTLKRKKDEDEDWTPKKLQKQRSGARTKRA